MLSIRYNSRVKYEEIKNDPQRITKIKPFKNKYNQEGIKVPSQKDHWKNFEKNNIKSALNVSCAKKEK